LSPGGLVRRHEQDYLATGVRAATGIPGRQAKSVLFLDVFELVGSTAKGLRTMTTDWTFGGLWPFEPRWFETSDGRMHYVDEGPRDGRPVVLVHGNPTWGFLYRNFIGPLTEAGHRAIVPDHLGFGRSDKPTDPELYRIPRHVTRLEALLESLDLGDAVVVVQD
jgi:alpha/beta hydrolase fold